jgi:hypothetical protein
MRAPWSEKLRALLAELYSEDDARLVAAMPWGSRASAARRIRSRAFASSSGGQITWRLRPADLSPHSRSGERPSLR